MRAFILRATAVLSTNRRASTGPCEALRWAFEIGVECCTLIPTRGGNGAMEDLQSRELFATPKLAALERAMTLCLADASGRVFVDLWDIERLALGEPDAAARMARLRRNESRSGGAMIRMSVEVAVLGSGFAGTLTALMLHLRGYRVVLLERGSHPRFALGESSTPLGNLTLEEIASEYGLDWLAPLAEYGSWKRTYPNLVCGPKRGFTFVNHRPDTPYSAAPHHADELLVAASPDEEHADTHWLAADFDHFLLQQSNSRRRGVSGPGEPGTSRGFTPLATERRSAW